MSKIGGPTENRRNVVLIKNNSACLFQDVRRNISEYKSKT